MKTIFQFVFLFSIFFFNAQERVLKDSDFLIINKNDTDVNSIVEDFLNFHVPVKTKDNFYNSKEKNE